MEKDDQHNPVVSDSQRLAEVKPRNKQEAIDVMNWLIGQQDHIEGEKRDVYC